MKRVIATAVAAIGIMGLGIAPAHANSVYTNTWAGSCGGTNVHIYARFGYETATGKRNFIDSTVNVDNGGSYIGTLNAVGWINSTAYSNGARVFNPPTNSASDVPDPSGTPFVSRSLLHSETQMGNSAHLIVCDINIPA